MECPLNSNNKNKTIILEYNSTSDLTNNNKDLITQEMCLYENLTNKDTNN